jgi:hypothetical protein
LIEIDEEEEQSSEENNGQTVLGSKQRKEGSEVNYSHEKIKIDYGLTSTP